MRTALREAESPWGGAADAGSSACYSVTTERGGIGWEVGGRFKREGTYLYPWLIHADVWQKSTQHCKAPVLQLTVFCFVLFFFLMRKEKKNCPELTEV